VAHSERLPGMGCKKERNEVKLWRVSSMRVSGGASPTARPVRLVGLELCGWRCRELLDLRLLLR